MWDWNGTLLGDTAVTVASARSGLAAIGIVSLVDVDLWRKIATRPLSETYVRLAGRDLTPEEWLTVIQVWDTAYRSTVSRASLNDGVLEALTTARDAGLTQSIVSLNVVDEVRLRAARLGIAPYFTDIVGSRPGDWGLTSQPTKADLLRSHAATRRLDPADVLVIGDMTDDADAAEQAGMRSVLVPVGDTSKERLIASGHRVVDTLPQAVALATTPGPVRE